MPRAGRSRSCSGRARRVQQRFAQNRVEAHRRTRRRRLRSTRGSRDARYAARFERAGFARRIDIAPSHANGLDLRHARCDIAGIGARRASSAAMSEGSTPWRSAASASATASGKLAVRGRIALRLRAPAARRSTLARRKVHLFGISVDFLRFGTVRRLVQLRFQMLVMMRVGYLRLDARARGNADGGDGIRAERTPASSWRARATKPAASGGMEESFMRMAMTGPAPNFTSAQVNGTGCSPLFCLASFSRATRADALGELLVEPRGQRIAPKADRRRPRR